MNAPRAGRRGPAGAARDAAHGPAGAAHGPAGAAPRTTAAQWAGRVTLAAVWLYEGLWLKVLGHGPDQWRIVASVPALPPSAVAAAVVAIGLAETAIAAWIVLGRAPRTAALTQTVMLVAFNAGGLLFAGDHLAEPGRMLTTNAALLALAWALVPPARGRPA